MLARLSKTLSTNAAIAGTVALVIGASGGAATLAAGHSPAPGSSHASDSASPEPTDDPTDEATEAPESPDDASAGSDQGTGDQGTRPTDTHGYCVSQVAQATPSAPSGTGSDTVNHGSLVSAAAHACGKNAGATGKPAQTHGKAFGRHHGTGRPAGVPTGH